MKVAIIYNQDITGVLNTMGIQNREFYSEKNVKRVASCLEKGGHNVRILDGNMYIIDRLRNFMPRIIEGERIGMVFNMAYGIQGESRYTHIPSLLEMLGIPYIGSTPSGHALALDKVMTKVVWQSKGLPTPDFWVFNSSADDLSGVKFPVIVKPKMESVSFGLKVVKNENELKESIEFVVKEFQQQALVEQFIRGREFCVGLLGNAPIEAFPVLEIDLDGDPDGIQTVDDKRATPRQKICPADISDELSKEMTALSIKAFNALELRDYARVDIRLDDSGNIYLLEINSMASLGRTGSYSTAAEVAGYDFCRLVNKILDVAVVRYFSNSLMSELPEEKNKKLPLHSRLRTFIRGRQQNMESLLEKIVNMGTYVRNIEGINQCSSLIKLEFTKLGFTNEIFPQLEVGNLVYFSNSTSPDIDNLILISVDDFTKMPDQENLVETEHRLYGTGVWANKSGVVAAIAALQALKFAKILKKKKIGVMLITDSSLSGKFSSEILNARAEKAKTVLSMHGGNLDGSIVTSRSGSALYTLEVKLKDRSIANNVALTSYYFFKVLTSIIDIGKNDLANVITPYNTGFQSNIFKMNAYGSAKISVRFNTMAEFEKIDEKIRKIVSFPKDVRKKVQVNFDGGATRQPMQENELTDMLFRKISDISRKIDTTVTREHRWTSADICNIEADIPKIDGLGAIGGFDMQKSEFIIRHSLIDRALLLALLLIE